MGQSHSKAPSQHAQSPASLDADPSKRPTPTSACGWIKIPRSRFMLKHRHTAPSTDVASQPHHHFIPKQQRQRSVGPIRSRPEPSEYKPRHPSQPLFPLTPNVRIQERRSSRAFSTEGERQRCLPVDVVGMTIDSSLSAPKLAFGSADTGNLSQSSFTSLAPPVPPSPVPPLRKQRRPSAQAVKMQDRSDSADSNFTAGLGDVANASSSQNLQQIKAASEPPSAATMSGVAGTVASSMTTSLAAGDSSTAATSLNPASASHAAFARKAAGGSPAHLTLSPPSPASGRLSEASDAGTKEILLSDRDSVAAPKMSSDSFVRGPIDEQHPDLPSFYPAGSSLSRPVGGHTVTTTVSSPPSRMIELETGPARHVGAAPDLSSPRRASGQYDGVGRGASLHSTTEASRSFRSFRSTSDGSVRPYRPLPAVPVRARGYSLGLATDRRDPSYGAESYVTADAHSVDRPAAYPIDGLPASSTQQPPFKLMGMVAAATSPTQYTHSSHAPSATTDNDGRRFSRSSAGSLASPVSGPRPLPPIHSKGVDAAAEPTHAQWKGKGKRSSYVSGIVNDGPPLSPSAFYESTPQMPFVPIPLSPAATRHSWASSDEPWSATVVTPSSTFGAVRGLARPEQSINDSHALHRALAHPGQHTSVDPPFIDDDTDAELSRLEQTRSGSRTLPPPQDVHLPDSLERAPYADTGVQASLAALRALESPGESLRTVLARQRIYGEPEASVMELLRDTHVLDSEGYLDDEAVLAASGPRRRRRAAPYPISSDEVSSSGRSWSDRRVLAAGRGRRQGNWTGMAEVSSASQAEASGRGSDSESATLAAVRLGSAGARDASSTAPSLGHGECAVRQQRPRHQRYVTARSSTNLTAQAGQEDVAPSDGVDRSESNRSLETSQSTDPPSSRRRTTEAPSTPLVAFPRSNPSSHLDTPSTTTTPIARKDDRLARRMHQQQRQRSRSDAHASSARSSKLTNLRTERRDTEKSRYDAQIAELLLLRDKVLQLESSIGHSVTDGGWAMGVADSVKTFRTKSRPSKLGYTVPDIVAWQAGLGGNRNSASSTVV
ncbi:uncharacterized protein SRS1_14125 [Sporisorium reilianum f. sp. reilianum]|uniref:Uncharacterized protein n=1 Tax=Sporisorium reilianum f. sp. reilianum TaxID=72559 RepID=A0A2N8UE92_9BASI|nr:uncharacterized protein SRS1_14125 [Sporisorium reilianum f. sp. reilianum]